MVGSSVKGKASTSISKCEALTLMSVDPEPLKSSMEGSSGRSIDGQGENKIGNKEEKPMDGQKTNENFCRPAVGNETADSKEVGDDGNYMERVTVNEIKVNNADSVPVSGKTQGNSEKVYNGGGVINAENMTTEEMSVEDNETAIYGLDIKDANTLEESKSSVVALDNMFDRGLAASELLVTGENLKDNPENEKEAVKNTEVPGHSNLDNGEIECRKKDSSIANNVKAAAINVNIPERKLTTQEMPVKDNEAVIYGLGIQDANIMEERKCLEVTTDNVVNGGLAATERQIIDKNLTDNSQNEEEAIQLNTEVPVGTNLDNLKVECRGEDTSIANNVKAVHKNVNIPKRRPLNRKMFEKKVVLGNSEASMKEAKPQCSIRNDACNEINEVDINEPVKNDDNGDAKPLVDVVKKPNRVRRKVLWHMTDASDKRKCKLTDELEKIENAEADERDVKNEEAEKSQKNEMEKVEKEHTSKVAIKRSKSSQRIDSAGMIFMCSSETKEDCYRYRVLGLPTGKRDIVSKIYEGMKLFLFDFELKMMYGIYKAAGPGGYHIEPRAFRSQFPSQVRFTVLEDCVPLAEEKFRRAIKDNYYTKNKFNYQLTSKQVKHLCKLFHETGKIAISKRALRSRVSAAPSPFQQDRKRKRVEDSRRAGPISSLEWERSRRQFEKGVRGDPLILSERYYHLPNNYEPDVTYERETYPLPEDPPTLYQPPPAQQTPHAPSDFNDGPLIDDMYTRDFAPEYREPSLSPGYRERSLSAYGHPVKEEHHDRYISYVEAHAYHEPVYETSVIHAYQERAYETGTTHTYREAAYETGVGHAYQEPGYETRVMHAYQQPAYDTSVCHAYREPGYETGVIHPYREPACEIVASQELHDHSSDRVQVEYYRRAENHGRPPLPPYCRY